MTRTAALRAVLAGLALVVVHACLLAACDRVVELEPHPDAGSLPDAGSASDALDPGLGSGDGGDLSDGGSGTTPDAI